MTAHHALPGAVVDVSSVCWSERLPPLGRHFPLLQRLFMVREAWRARFGAGAPLALVADDSLLKDLLPQDSRRLRQLQGAAQAGDGDEVRFVPYADPVILQMARERDWYVLSGDRFIDLRRFENWMERHPERFLSWTTESAGGGADATRLVRLHPSGIEPGPAHEVSPAIRDERHEKDLDPGRDEHRRILRSHWRCTARGCPKAMMWPDRLLDLPLVDRDGHAVCACGAPLQEAGSRGTTRMFVVSDATAPELPGGLSAGEFLRFPVSVGNAVRLGRGTLSHGINLAARELNPPVGVKRVSRAHLTITLEGSTIDPQASVVDLGSGNGTVLLRGTAGERRLEPGERVRFGDSDRLVLGETVLIRLSGQSCLTEQRISPLELGGGGGGTRLG